MGIKTCVHGCCLSSAVLHFIFWDRISHETRKGQQGISKCSLQTKFRVTHRRTAGVSGTYNIEKPTPAWVTNWESSVFGVPSATSSRQLDHRAVPSSEIICCLYWCRKGPHKCCKTCCLLCVVSLERLPYSSRRKCLDAQETTAILPLAISFFLSPLPWCSLSLGGSHIDVWLFYSIYWWELGHHAITTITTSCFHSSTR